MSVAEFFHTLWTVKGPRLKQTCYRSAWLPLTVLNYLPIKRQRFYMQENQKKNKKKIWTWMLWLDNHVMFGRTSECFLLEYQCVYDDRWSWMCERPTHLMFTCWLTYSMQVCRMCLTVLYSWFLLEWDSDLLKQSGMRWVFLFFLILVPEFLVIE